MVKASKHTSKAKSNPKKTSSPHPSYKERHKLYMQQLEDAKGNKHKKKAAGKKKVIAHDSESSEVGSDAEDFEMSSDSEPKQQTKKKSKKFRKYPTVAPTNTSPFGAAGKKGTGEHGSKGYNLKEHMGLESDDAKYLDIRAAVRDEVADYRLEGRKRKQDPQNVASILRSVEKRFPELKQYKNSWPIEAMITSVLCNKSDYQRNKEQYRKAAHARVRRQEQQERQERQEQHEEVHVSLKANGEERANATVPQEDQAQESAVHSNDAGDAEDEQGDVEDQGEEDHKQSSSKDMSQTLSDSDSYALESDAATWSKGNKPNAKKEGLKPVNN
ncbi:hypothetical protein JB92DRAFT_3149326 [Gautieria morchelliformis]|nr:hypothetical protein JB92DRAFT_3149326 [Gautieria morchelliformis]